MHDQDVDKKRDGMVIWSGASGLFRVAQSMHGQAAENLIYVMQIYNILKGENFCAVVCLKDRQNHGVAQSQDSYRSS